MLRTIQEYLNSQYQEIKGCGYEEFWGPYKAFEEEVNDFVSTDPEYAGEEGLMRAYEDFAEEWELEQLAIYEGSSQTVWVWWKR